MSRDCFDKDTITPQVFPSKPYFRLLYPASIIVFLTTSGISKLALLVTSPPTTINPVLVKHSIATLLSGSCLRNSSSKASETWSHNLSGCPSATLSDVNKKDLLFNITCGLKQAFYSLLYQNITLLIFGDTEN